MIEAHPDVVYHLAAVSFGPDARHSPADAVETNVIGRLRACLEISWSPLFASIRRRWF